MSETQEPTLRHGDIDIDGWVEYLQRLLVDHGFNAGVADGDFGGQTLAAVHAFQDARHLLPDGVVGNQTWAALRGNPEQPPSTDGLAPHTFHEAGAEARWFRENGKAVVTTADGGVRLLAASVGDVNIESSAFFATGTFVRPDQFEFAVVAGIEDATVAPGTNFNFFVPLVFNQHGAGTYRATMTMPDELGGDRQEFEFTFDGDPPDQLLTVASILLCPHGGRVSVTPTSGATLGAPAPVLLISDTNIVLDCPDRPPDRPPPCVRVNWVSSGGRTLVRGVPVLTRAATGICVDIADQIKGPVVIAG
jgi:hypothetical protein